MPEILNAQLNKTSDGGLSPGMQTTYDRALLRNTFPKLVHYRYCQRKPIPMHGGKTIQFRKFNPFPVTGSKLEEGVVPDGLKVSQTSIEATIEQRGDFIAVSDVLDMTHMDPVIAENTKLLGRMAGETIDFAIRDEMSAGTNVIYAGGKTSRATLTRTDKLTSTELRMAVRMLKKNKAIPFEDGYFVAIVGPDTTYDLQKDEDFIKVAHYQDKSKIEKGEIGRLFGCRIVEAVDAKIFSEAGAEKIDVASTVVLGQEAVGVVEIGGKSMKNGQIIVKPRGSSGTADPLNQISTIGWKVEGFTTKILQPAWIVRIESGFSA